MWGGEQRCVSEVIFSGTAVKVVVRASVLRDAYIHSGLVIIVCGRAGSCIFHPGIQSQGWNVQWVDACVKNELSHILLCFS